MGISRHRTLIETLIEISEQPVKPLKQHSTAGSANILRNTLTVGNMNGFSGGRPGILIKYTVGNKMLYN